LIKSKTRHEERLYRASRLWTSECKSAKQRFDAIGVTLGRMAAQVSLYYTLYLG
jgi:hypothetical protein